MLRFYCGLALSALYWQLATSLELPDKVGRLPALGWNSWNAYQCDIDESSFLDAANALVDRGFKDAGYEYISLLPSRRRQHKHRKLEYVVIDDCWSVKDHRDNKTKALIPHPTKFPKGIKGLADKVHDLGLKLGIYSDAGFATCAWYPGSLGYEEIDAASWAAWGVDYLKYDNCHVDKTWTEPCETCQADYVDRDGTNGHTINGTCTIDRGLCPPEGDASMLCNSTSPACPPDRDYSKSKTAERYNRMRDALNAQNRTILFSLCSWGRAESWTWANSTGQSWRTTDDIQPNWKRIMQILNINSFLLNHGDFHGHNDPDMLEVGNGNLTLAECRSHFALWAMMKSPLMIGTDLTRLSDEHADILLNQQLLAFNQDALTGKSAAPYRWGTNLDWTFNQSHPAQYWSGRYSDGVLVALLNTLEEKQDMFADPREIPELRAEKEYEYVNVWTGQVLGRSREGWRVDVGKHDTAVLLVRECDGRAKEHEHEKRPWYQSWSQLRFRLDL